MTEQTRHVREFWVRTGKGGVTKVVREHYLRTDLVPPILSLRSHPLQMRSALANQQQVPQQPEQQATRPWAVMCPDTCRMFLELLEVVDVTHVIVLETVLLHFGPVGAAASSFPYRFLPRLRCEPCVARGW
jgi:hypothetical protein